MKRLLDLTVGLLGLPVLVAVWPVVALARRLEGRGSVLRRELRVGVQRRTNGSDERGARRLHDVRGEPFVLRRFEVRDGSRHGLSAVGRVLRATGVDGLPQVLHLLSGRLSLVGPRPASPRFLDRLHRVSPALAGRLGQVRPGILGPAQRLGPERVDFHAQLAEKLYAEPSYGDQLDRCGMFDVLWLDVGHAIGSLVGRFRRGRGAAVRLELPRTFGSAEVDADDVVAAVRGVVTDVERRDDPDTTVAGWVVPGPRTAWPAVRDEVVDAVADEVAQAEAGQLRLGVALEPRNTGARDVLAVEVSGGPTAVVSLAEALAPVWRAVAAVRPGEGVAERLDALLLEGLARVAEGAPASAVRLAARVELHDHGVEVAVERLAAAGSSVEALGGLKSLLSGRGPALPDARTGS